MGIVLSLEQNRRQTHNTIRSVRISAAGPLGGIGDALFWLTLVPITAGTYSEHGYGTVHIAWTRILFLLIFNVVQFALRFCLDDTGPMNLVLRLLTILTR